MIDFSIDILRECEEHCQLVSKSGVLRVDLGAEFIFCDPAQSEEELRAAVGKKHQLNQQWHCTGAGFIVRFFLNEVRSMQTMALRCCLVQPLSVRLVGSHSACILTFLSQVTSTLDINCQFPSQNSQHQ